jgi:sugar diacid utilization regulator
VTTELVNSTLIDSSASDVLTTHRLGRRADGGAAIVRWLARRTGSWAGLIDRSGAVLVGDRVGLDDTTARTLAEAAQDMTGRGLRAFSTTSSPSGRITLLQIDVPDPAAPATAPILAVAGTEPVPQALAAGAATVLGTSWWAERTRRACQRLDAVDTRTREAVVQLLMARHTTTAQQIASVFGSALPDPARLHVIECPPHTRDAILTTCRRWAARSAFVAPCPLRHRHVIVIAPAAADPAIPRLATTVTERHPGCIVGTSDVIALSDTPAGYAQAHHALTVARSRTDRAASFDATLDPATLLGPPGAAWANTLLAPLTGHRPARATDPDAGELITTLRSWLSFSTGAARQLKIHRNTLRTRLERIEQLLGLDLERTDHQAPLALALRTTTIPRTEHPPPGERVPTLEDLLRQPALIQWAHTVLRPVRDARGAAQLEHTLRTWLDNHTRLSATATALDISVPGTRKRLLRLEQHLQRSLLNTPHTRHDLWLATRTADR